MKLLLGSDTGEMGQLPFHDSAIFFQQLHGVKLFLNPHQQRAKLCLNNPLESYQNKGIGLRIVAPPRGKTTALGTYSGLENGVRKNPKAHFTPFKKGQYRIKQKGDIRRTDQQQHLPGKP